MVRERCAVPMAANPTAWKVLVSKIQMSLSMLFVLLLVLLFFVFVIVVVVVVVCHLCRAIGP